MCAAVILVMGKGLLEVRFMRTSVIMPARLGVQMQPAHLYCDKRYTGKGKNK